MLRELQAVLWQAAQVLRPEPYVVPQKQGQCRKCHRRVPMGELVYVNHCYHEDPRGRRGLDHKHTDCAGIRALCAPCHTAMAAPEREAYYRALLADLGDAYPPSAVLGLDRGGTMGELGHAGYGVRLGG